MFSVFDTLQIWLDAGAPPEKTLMGFAQYGRGMTLETEETGLYCPAKDGNKINNRHCNDTIYSIVFLKIRKKINHCEIF